MPIKIAQRFRPFSHTPGVRCLVPGTHWVLQAFPTQLQLHPIEGGGVQVYPLEHAGPPEQFTVIQDLERGVVSVHSTQYCVHVIPALAEASPQLFFQRKVPQGVVFPPERLALGMHKQQKWEAVWERGDVREIFPLWMRLGAALPPMPPRKEGGAMGALLDACCAATQGHRPEQVTPLFLKLLRAGFSGMLVPRVCDTEHQGILAGSGEEGSSALHVLAEGAQWIRSLFFVTQGSEAWVLPCLPPECFAGRLCHCVWGTQAILDLEWTKKQVRTVAVHPLQTGPVVLHFPSDIRRYRLRYGRNERGTVHEARTPLLLEAGRTLLLDQFQK